MKRSMLRVFLHSPRFRLRGACLLVLGLTLVGCNAGENAAGTAVPTPAQQAAAAVGQVDDFAVVDCLLPGRIQRLGRRLTYLTPRQPVRTTAQDCAIRGGEYTAYDRSDYATALKVWLPQAEEGDKVAQTYVGEIYEKKLGSQADYAQAAAWYRKAAEQGYTRAQINLAHLYETGLGVEKDPAAARKWYQRASGLSTPLALDPETLNAPVNNAETQALKQQVLQLTKESQTLRQELERARQQLDQTRRDLEQRQREADTAQQEIEATQQALRQRQQQVAAAPDDSAIKQLEAQLAERQVELARHRQEAEQLRQNIAQLEQKAEGYRTQLASTPAPAPTPVPTLAAHLPPPSIEIIDPPLLNTRALKLAAAVTEQPKASRIIVGRVTAPAGVLNFTVNDRQESLDANGIFRASIPLSRPTTTVQIVAVDTQGKRTPLDFEFTLDAIPERLAPSPQGSKYGTYYALIIGNQKYTSLPQLATPEHDAKSVAEVLSTKYGFKTTVLLNGTRHAILEALNEFRKTLTDNDNLLIYYAGHGQLQKIQEKTSRGYWVPVDGQADSPTNWISSFDINDLLGIMTAKHVLVVADSCYAGALTRSGLSQLETGMSDQARQHWISVVAEKRSRTVLASGDDKPVLDSGGGAHSVFAKAFLDVLRANTDVLEGERLHKELKARVAFVAEAHGVEQLPQYAPIHYAGHEGGEFLFVPQPAAAKVAGR